MRAVFSLFLLSALWLAIAGPAHAWGARGHRLVGALAEENLSAQARRELATLLAEEPDPSLAGIASWADELRSKDRGLGRRSAPWHYVNLGEHGCTYDEARDCAKGGCVVEAIRAQTRILADAAQPVEARRQALKFVVHFVADVHQPLHAAFARDKGGNTVQISLPGKKKGKRRGSNLHSYWDSGMIEAAGLDDAQWLQRLRVQPTARPDPSPAPTWAPLPPQAGAWAEKSCRIALSNGFYPERARLEGGYAERWQPVVEAQLRLAAAQLRVILEAALVPAHAQPAR